MAVTPWLLLSSSRAPGRCPRWPSVLPYRLAREGCRVRPRRELPGVASRPSSLLGVRLLTRALLPWPHAHLSVRLCAQLPKLHGRFPARVVVSQLVSTCSSRLGSLRLKFQRLALLSWFSDGRREPDRGGVVAWRRRARRDSCLGREVVRAIEFARPRSR
ncbi:uncharacterized protein LOC100191353 [Zea mays]|jgi:hypothetical protein|uniref:Uncharacterized protein n=1 Tax=Zea mays TaxID=4577 RepID=B4F8I4_MAIZE|nr:uncharacterized protein LOC100191353 [Zea mays]ACF78427.1 unknown [Zea mays]|eukprot:NP_001130259.1 uncharacterized protein LOC100191353 [Zea mays]